MPRCLLAAALSLVTLTLATPALADDPPTFADRDSEEFEENDRTFALMLNPLDAATGVYGGEADFVLGRHFAASLEGDFYNLSGNPGTGLGVGLLVYPMKPAFHGLYLEPRAVYVRPLSESPVRFDWSTDVLGLGATVGWQWTWDYGFSLRLGGGAMDYLGGARSASGALALSGPQVVLDGEIGWAF